MTVASRLSTTGMDVGVLVGAAVAEGSVNVNVSVGMTAGGATVEAAECVNDLRHEN